jgi:hypothetical protein
MHMPFPAALPVSALPCNGTLRAPLRALNLHPLRASYRPAGAAAYAARSPPHHCFHAQLCRRDYGTPWATVTACPTSHTSLPLRAPYRLLMPPRAWIGARVCRMHMPFPAALPVSALPCNGTLRALNVHPLRASYRPAGAAAYAARSPPHHCFHAQLRRRNNGTVGDRDGSTAQPLILAQSAHFGNVAPTGPSWLLARARQGDACACAHRRLHTQVRRRNNSTVGDRDRP